MKQPSNQEVKTQPEDHEEGSPRLCISASYTETRTGSQDQSQSRQAFTTGFAAANRYKLSVRLNKRQSFAVNVERT